MLETVREFGGCGSRGRRGRRSPRGQRAWATATPPPALAVRPRAVRGDRRGRRRGEQPRRRAARRARRRRPRAVVQLLAALGRCGRSAATTRGCSRWAARSPRDRRLVPPPELEETRGAMVITLINTMVGRRPAVRSARSWRGRDRARRPAADRGGRCCSRTTGRPRRRSRPPRRLRRSPTRTSRGRRASGSATFGRTPATCGAIAAAERALTLVPKRGPWSAAILRTQLAQLTMHRRPGRPWTRAGRAPGAAAARRDRRRGPAARAARPLRDRRGRPGGRRGGARRITGSTTASGARRRRGPADRRGRARARPRRRRPPCAPTAVRRGPARCACRGSSDRHWSRGAVRGGDRARGARLPRGDRADNAYGADCSPPAASASCACSIPRTRNSTTRSPGWCCSRSAPGACCAARRRPATRSGCSCSPSGSPTTG